MSNHNAPTTTSSAGPSRQSKRQWFGSAITTATNGASGLPIHPFPADLLDAMEPHIQKAVTRRREALAAIRQATTEPEYDAAMKKFQESNLSREGQFSFDTTKLPLREAFQSALGLPPMTNCDLSKLHHYENKNKLHLLRHLTTHYETFQSVYDDFVRKVCCPKLQELHHGEKLDEIYYQCFPCVRIMQPGEFSIGPHADVAYGHHPFSTNFYVLLTDLTLQESSAALFLESQMGSEDWHPVICKYGEVKHFPGAVLTHWTTDNNTSITRVSLDFRLIPGDLYRSMADGVKEKGGQCDVYRQKEGYYSRCRRRLRPTTNDDNLEAALEWERIGPLQVPDDRVGFPWTVSNWDKLLRKKRMAKTEDEWDTDVAS